MHKRPETHQDQYLKMRERDGLVPALAGVVAAGEQLSLSHHTAAEIMETSPEDVASLNWSIKIINPSGLERALPEVGDFDTQGRGSPRGIRVVLMGGFSNLEEGQPIYARAGERDRRWWLVAEGGVDLCISIQTRDWIIQGRGETVGS